ncbi:NAD(+)/NADH kinase [Candidatus Haliotispira prima]|uniref:NAD kinase n=1 Tax=Candidatus Haliotispira prima TaxID=3034016 RepID=A0ABY8MJZ5_9SPIO|nr:NAD(+)/NADH kinase [Candidatus Haliotispira prima]
MPENTAKYDQEILFTDYAKTQESTLFPLDPPANSRYSGLSQDLSQAIRRVFIYANPSKPKTSTCLKEMIGILKKLGIESLVYSEFKPSRAHLIEYIAQALNIPLQAKSQEYYGEHPEEPFVGLNGQEIFDLVITVGGDGTVLKYLSYSPFREVPILPVNTGSLGYITSISFHNMAESMAGIFSGAFVYSPRILLKARLLDSYQNPKHYRDYFALNEIAISSCRAGLLADMELQVGNSSIPLQGDGIIVATPTGSTAYSLAAGGPIVDAEMEALIITPVSPFSLATRPVVTPSSMQLFVRNAAGLKNVVHEQAPPTTRSPKELHELDSSEAPLSIAIDGWALGLLYPGESLYITGSSERIQFLATSHNNSYFENIRTKLGWHNVAPRRP